MNPVAIFFLGLILSLSGLAADRTIRLPKVANALQKLSIGPVSVCGKADLSFSEAGLKKTLFQGRPARAYFLAQPVAHAEYLAAFHSLGSEEFRAWVQEKFQPAELLELQSNMSVRSLGRPDSAGGIQLSFPQTTKECLLDGPKEFSCGPSVSREVCCRDGLHKMLGLTLRWSQKDGAGFELRYRPSTGSVLKSSQSKALVWHCHTSEGVSFLE